MPDLSFTRSYLRSLSGIERRLGGDLMADYRAYRKDLLDALERFELSPAFTAAILGGGARLRQAAGELARAHQPQIAEAAHTYADRQLEVLRPAGAAPAVTPQVIASSSFETALTASVDLVQASLVSTASQLRLAGEDVDLVGRLLSVNILDSRASAWRLGRNRLASDVILAIWAAANGITGMIYDQAGAQMGETYQRQAIAAIDENTTDCCLRVHGQTVGMEEKFHLTGVPRFSDYVHAPPFHFSCRTAVALYHPAMESVGVTTSEMKAAARAERRARRRTGRRQEIHPAHATSRRS